MILLVILLHIGFCLIVVLLLYLHAEKMLLLQSHLLNVVLRRIMTSRLIVEGIKLSVVPLILILVEIDIWVGKIIKLLLA